MQAAWKPPERFLSASNFTRRPRGFSPSPEPAMGRQGPSWASPVQGRLPGHSPSSSRSLATLSRAHSSVPDRGDAVSGFEDKRAGIDTRQPLRESQDSSA
jgi:hypothetical protein